jgi:hypothetical protein
MGCCSVVFEIKGDNKGMQEQEFVRIYSGKPFYDYLKQDGFLSCLILFTNLIYTG